MVRNRGKKIGALAVAMVLAAVLVPFAALAVSIDPNYSWYTGHEGDASYTLSTPGQVVGFANLVNGTADVDGDGTADTAVTFEGKTVSLASNLFGYNFQGAAWTPIGSADHPFLGAFDGGGQTVDNFVIDSTSGRASYLGFFGYAGAGSSISHLTVGKNAQIAVSRDAASADAIDHVGMLVGYAGGSLSDCSNLGSLSVSSSAAQTSDRLQVVSFVGGVAGECVFDLSGCTNAGSVHVFSDTTPDQSLGTSYIVRAVGGVAGMAGDSSRMGSYNNPVAADPSTHGTVSDCTNTAQITVETTSEAGLDRFGSTAYARSVYVGGVVGYSQDSVVNCVNGSPTTTTSVSDAGYVNAKRGSYTGGIVGSVRAAAMPDNVMMQLEADDGIEGNDPISVANCINYGDVYGFSSVGGIAGTSGTYTSVTGCETALKTQTYAGGSSTRPTYVVATRWNKPAPAGIIGTTDGDVSYCANFATVASGQWSDEASRTIDQASGYYASGIVGMLSYISKVDAATGSTERLSPIPEIYGCYNAGSILAQSGMRQRGIVGELSGYAHDNLLLSGCVENDQICYGDDPGETEASGTAKDNKVVTADELKDASSVAALNAPCDTVGWGTYWTTSNGANSGYPVLSWTGAWDGSTTDLSGASVSLASDAAYNGGEAVPEATVTLNGVELVQGADYRVVPQSGAVEVSTGGAYTASIEGIGAYTGTIDNAFAYDIDTGSIAQCDVVVEPTTYNYESQYPAADAITVTCNGHTVDPSEYEIVSLTYQDASGAAVATTEPVDARIYTLSIKASASSTHFNDDGTTATGTYRIKPVDLMRDVVKKSNPSISFAGATYDWVDSTAEDDKAHPKTTLPYLGGAAVEPTVSGVTYLGHDLVEGVDYSVVYGNPNSDDASSATNDAYNTGVAGGTTVGCVTIRYITHTDGTPNNFTNYANMFFNITDQGTTQDISKATVVAPDQVYDGSAWEPVEVYFGAAKLTEGSDYTISYSDNVGPGTATYTITGTGAFAGTRTGTFAIEQGDLYTLEYAFDKTNKTAQVTGVVANTSRATFDVAVPATVTKDGVAYTVTSVGENAFGGPGSSSFTGSAENEAKAKVANVTLPATVTSIGDYAFGAPNSSQQRALAQVTFDGESQLRTIGEGAFAWCANLTSFTFGPKVDTIGKRAFCGCTALKAITFETADAALPSNVYEGSAALGAFGGCDGVTVYGYSSAAAVRALAADNGSASAGANGGKNFTFVALQSLDDATIAPISTQFYTGRAIEPAVEVTLDGATLEAGTDYSVSYADNVEAGTATVTVTGMGDYAGTKAATFEIAPFSDVDATTPHEADIVWLAGTGISTGYRNEDGTYRFEGMTTVYRQDMAAFLRREAKALGIGDAATWTPSAQDWNTFADVNKDTPHAEDILWLYHAGIAEGYVSDDGTRTFGGMTTVYRQDMAAFLHRMASLGGLGAGIVPSESFSDVDESTPHYEDIAWLAQSGITSGYKDGTFRGMWPTFRQDMAAFLHRLANLQ